MGCSRGSGDKAELERRHGVDGKAYRVSSTIVGEAAGWEADTPVGDTRNVSAIASTSMSRDGIRGRGSGTGIERGSLCAALDDCTCAEVRVTKADFERRIGEAVGGEDDAPREDGCVW
jgi:hypothetical protein